MVLNTKWQQPKKWIPTKEEAKYLSLIQSMACDCRMARGTDTRETFITNLRMMVDSLEAIPK